MESRRQARFSKVMQEELAAYFLKNSRKFSEGMINVNRVRVSGDLGVVSVYLGIFSTKEEPQKVVDFINASVKEIRGFVGNQIRHQVKKVPELRFYYDDTADYVEKMDEIFERLNKPKDKGEE